VFHVGHDRLVGGVQLGSERLVSRSARVTLEWGDGDHLFFLGVDQLLELDELCGVGPGFLLGKVLQGVYGNWKARELREVLRLGLIGGGAAAPAAARLVKRYFDSVDRPIGESLVQVQVILEACLIGVEDDTPGERAGESLTTAPLSPTAGSALPTSSDQPAPPASRPAKRAAARSGK
jgi:hypothetical protein